MNLKNTNLVFRVLLLFILVSLNIFISYSANFYEDVESGEFFYYTSNQAPTIDLSIDSRSNSVLSINSILFNSDPRSYNFLPVEIQAYGDRDIPFNFPQDLVDELEQNPVSVELEITSLSDSSEQVETIGDPTSFNIEYLDSTQLTHYSSQKDTSLSPVSQIIILRGDDNEITFHFDNKIVEYSIQIGSLIDESDSLNSNILNEIPNEFSVDISDLTAGTYAVEILYKDVAGNQEIESLEIAVSNPPLEITKVYSMKDSRDTYKYYFNSRFDENRIYSNTREFNLVFETNYEASCYIEKVGEFKDFFNKTNSKTNQVKTHTLSVSIPSTSFQKEGMWVMCEDINSNFREEERIYLSETLFNNKELIDIEYIEPRNDFEIILARPEGLITYTPIKLEATTNYPSICEYEMSGVEETRYLNSNTSSNFLNHFRSNVLPVNDGNFEINITCIDKIYNFDTNSLNLEIDTSRATQLVDWSPKFTATSEFDLQMEISDSSADCGIIENWNDLGSNDLEENVISPSQKDGSTLYFTNLGPLSKNGKNEDLYLRCRTQEGIVEELKFYITYDPIGPTITSVDLYNDEYGPTEYFSNSTYMRIETNSDSSSVQYYTARFEDSNLSIDSNLSTIEINDNFSQDSSVIITATDNLNRVSNQFTKNFQFDTSPPSLDIQIGNSSTNRKVLCNDSESSCAQISYGTSSIESSCLARTNYVEEDGIDIFGKNYLCIDAMDEAGNRANLTEQVSSTTGPFNPSVNDTDDDLENRSEDPTFENPPLNDNNNSENEGRNESENESEDPLIDPADPADPVEEDEFNWLLLSAFAFILLATGAGGYYAYRKGYLDEQLVKMGVMKKNKGSDTTIASSQYSPIPKKDLNKNKFQSSISQSNTNQSKYDSHINKLNSFINSTLNKDSDLFNEFEKSKEKDPDKKSSLKDTLIKNQTNINDEKDSFEKFHKSRSTKK